MEVPESEAFVLHERRITNFLDMARNLNPLSQDDFLQHKNHVITWVEHSGKDYYLAEKLKQTKSKDKFVELLALRNNKDKAKYPEKEPDSSNHEVQLKKVEKKLKELDDEIVEPKKFQEHKPQLNIKFDMEDFQKLIDEAVHNIEMKHYREAVQTYELLKLRFEKAKTSVNDRKQLHKMIKEVYEKLAESVKK